MNKIKLGIVGAGMIVHDLFNFIHEIDTYDIQAICATKNSVEKLKELSVQHHIPYTFVNYEEMLEKADVDTIYIAVPNHLHYAYTKLALEKNKNVICEKPFTSNVKELQELVSMAREKDLILVEAITNQYLENYQSIREDLPKLGKIKIVECNYSQYSSRYNAFKEGEILPAFDYRKSGGALMDLNIYNIHFVVGLFGVPKDVHYYANIEQGIDTSGILILDYGTFKCVCIGAKDCKAPISSNIQGDAGCIHVPLPVSICKEYTYYQNDGHEETIDKSSGKHRMFYEFEAFANMIVNHDREKCDHMLDHSLIVMDIVSKAKSTANIVFSADQEG